MRIKMTLSGVHARYLEVVLVVLRVRRVQVSWSPDCQLAEYDCWLVGEGRQVKCPTSNESPSVKSQVLVKLDSFSSTYGASGANGSGGAKRERSE